MGAVPQVGRAQTGSADQTHQLYEQYGRQIYAYCLHRLRSREEAEDAVQTTFLNAFRSLEKGTQTQFEQAWLFKIAQNVCLERSESSGRRMRLESPSDLHVLQETAPAHELDDPEQLMGIEDALASIPANQRKAILLREWQGLSYKEIGEELGLSQSSVEMLLFRARRSLATALEQPQVESKRKRRTGAVNIGSLITAIKTLFTGGAAVKTIAVAVAAGTVAVMGAKPVAHTLLPSRPHHRAAVHVTAQAAVAPVAARTAVPVAAVPTPIRRATGTVRGSALTHRHHGAAYHVGATPMRAQQTSPDRRAPITDTSGTAPTAPAAAPAPAAPTPAASTPAAAPSTPAPAPDPAPASSSSSASAPAKEPSSSPAPKHKAAAAAASSNTAENAPATGSSEDPTSTTTTTATTTTPSDSGAGQQSDIPPATNAPAPPAHGNQGNGGGDHGNYGGHGGPTVNPGPPSPPSPDPSPAPDSTGGGSSSSTPPPPAHDGGNGNGGQGQGHGDNGGGNGNGNSGGGGNGNGGGGHGHDH